MTETYRSKAIRIGDLNLGGTAPVRIQSMANTDTRDQNASVAQCTAMIRAGAELVRLTTQGKPELSALAGIRRKLRERGWRTPVVADIHFSPSLALDACGVTDKIRINPGNYLKGGKVTDLLPGLLRACRQHGTAIRIGVNHGSLSPAIVEEFGNTPAGMVESAMRFLRVCRDHEFEQVVVSMKSSHPRVMIQSVRLLVRTMTEEGMHYPLHLGVTEAGAGPEGEIRSATGIAPLLLEGLGDTLRVSLTGPPETELPVARQLVRLFPKPSALPYDPFSQQTWDPFLFSRRGTRALLTIGGGNPVRIISSVPPQPEYDLLPNQLKGLGVSWSAWERQPSLLENGEKFLLLEQGSLSIQEVKSRLLLFCSRNKNTPVVFRTRLAVPDPDLFRLQLAGDLGSLLVDGALDAVWVENAGMDQGAVNELLASILQAAGARVSRAEYIACPSCGRTHFDILSRLEEIRTATAHLTGVRIAVMGCIVNGPGEMADAHYGFVGAGKGRITLYKGKMPVRKNIPENQALASLIELMKQEGDWKDPLTTAKMASPGEKRNRTPHNG
jgi:(E)-4-hydroxy-3-methylbut-2-enyl-diphosphate synthase